MKPVEQISIERWGADHPRFAALREVASAEEQERNLTIELDWHLTSHVLVALTADAIVGFLRFVVQPIGPDNDQPPVRVGEKTLNEAKVLAFGVVGPARRRGIGTKLQHAALEWARELSCYQVRSYSDGTRRANHHLKLKLGYAVHPVVRGEDKRGAYFVMPLRYPSTAEPASDYHLP